MVYVIVGIDPFRLGDVFLLLVAGFTSCIRHRIAGGLLGILLLLLGERWKSSERQGHQRQASKCGALSQSSRLHERTSREQRNAPAQLVLYALFHFHRFRRTTAQG